VGGALDGALDGALGGALGGAVGVNVGWAGGRHLGSFPSLVPSLGEMRSPRQISG